MPLVPLARIQKGVPVPRAQTSAALCCHAFAGAVSVSWSSCADVGGLSNRAQPTRLPTNFSCRATTCAPERLYPTSLSDLSCMALAGVYSFASSPWVYSLSQPSRSALVLPFAHGICCRRGCVRISYHSVSPHPRILPSAWAAPARTRAPPSTAWLGDSSATPLRTPWTSLIAAWGGCSRPCWR